MPLHLKSFLVLLATVSVSWAEPGPSARLEVEQLLGRLAASGCKFQRNGAWHSATEARAHLEKKYQYLLNKNLVSTSEDFISLAATKSSTSGKPYLVKCGSQEQVPSAAWMAAQLKEVRVASSNVPGKSN